MIQGPLPDCPRCQELIRALDEAYRLRKQAFANKVQAFSGTGTWALTLLTAQSSPILH